LDQEELASFRLASAVAGGSEGVFGARGGGPPGGKEADEDEEARQVDQTPARLLIVRQMYGLRKTMAPEGADGSPSAAAAADADLPAMKRGSSDLQDEEGGAAGTAEAPEGGGGGAESGEEVGKEGGPGAAGASEAIAVPEVEEEFDEDAILKRELARLRTGEDVIAFFAKNGSNTPIKFVYCRRREMHDVREFRPYDLEVIPEMMESSKGKTYAPSKLGEHFTISNKGVTHLCPGQQSEYMSLGDWMHQCLMYSVLTSMNFFKYYIHGKVYHRWRQHTRYTVYCHHRSRLARRLFLAKPMFVGPIVQLHREMHEVESVKVMSIGSNVYDLEVFENEQTRVRSSQGMGAAKEFEQGHDRAVNILNILVKKVSHSTEVSTKSDEHSALRPRMKSMVQEKKDAADNARRHQLAKQDQSMLGDCIRLVDYMFQACLVKVVIHATIDYH
jgi:dynein heavy chain